MGEVVETAPRRTRAKRRVALALATTLLLGAGPVLAQGGFSVARFQPTSSQRTGFITVESAQNLPLGGWEIGLVFDYADDPLVAEQDDERLFAVIDAQLIAHLMGAWAPVSAFQLSLDVPVYLVQTAGQDSILGAVDALEGAGIGDLRLTPKWRFYRGRPPGGSGVNLALLANIYFPTGDQDAYQGEDFRVEPRLALDWGNSGGWGIGLNAGFLVRPSSELANIEINNQFTWGAAGRIPLMGDGGNSGIAPLQGLVELNGAVTVGTEGSSAQENPLELLLGLRWRLSEWILSGGAGTGLVEGYGSPDVRIWLSVAYSTGEYAPDTDGDGYPDDEDDCPYDPEDFDGFEDGDGCPDPDNDGDGILDDGDQCPNDAEDVDGFEDEDGCPDPDNDGDGIIDSLDQCPEEPEDLDGFQDSDGCPDPDNDGDGLIDTEDECPNDAEDFDGIDDEDGCPEEDVAIVRPETIEITQQINFDNDSDRIRPESNRILDGVASLLRDNPDIRRLRIEGHTSQSGSASHNQTLSEGRAQSVLEALVGRGVERERLRSVGFGESRPLVDESQPRGEETNRRVEFHIEERAPD